MRTLIVEKDGSLAIKEIPKPRYNEKQALVKTISCGICNGTDTKLLHKAFKGFGDSRYPLMLGHEGVGEVIEIGKEVKTYKIGDKVLLPFVDPDRELYGELDSAWGAYSEYGVVTDVAAYEEGSAPEHAYGQTVLPDYVDPVDGAMIITLREVLSSIKRFGIKKDSSVAVFGCGPVGLTFIKFMSMLGARPILAFDIFDDKVQEAMEKGADYAFNSKNCDVGQEIHKVCPEGVEYVLDAVGILSLINQSMEYIHDGGKICCYGISPDCKMELDWSKAPYNWRLYFQQFPNKAEEGAATDQILSWIKTGKIDLKDYISDYFEFENILDAFEKMEHHQIKKKGIVVY